ncbi:MAG: T9SS type A sorting domain-containing protein [Bacteroidales bacterium]|nr:T9SS type A sorting domain-containing protein [Bacteroidales bacterium]
MTSQRSYLLSLILIFLAVGHLNALTEAFHPRTAPSRYPADTIKLLDSLHSYFWRTNIGYWVNQDLDLFSYDHNTDMIRWNRKHWDESYGYIWYDDFRVLYTLEGGQPVEELKQNYDLQTSQWINYTLFSYAFDGQGNKTEWKWQRWSAEKEEWINFRLNNYLYDVQGHQILSVSSIWDAAGNEWLLSQQTEISYDVCGADTLILTSYWSTSDSAWTPLGLRRNIYDQAGNRVREHMQYWDAGSSSWINSSNNISLYDEHDNLLQTTYQHWDEGLNGWVDRNLTEYSYNVQDLLSLYVTSMWDPSDSVWQPASRGLYAYDREGDESDFILQVWSQNGEWINQSHKRYVYYKVLSLQESYPSSEISCILTTYPTGHQCVRCCGLKNSQSYILNVYTLTGSLILTRAFNGDQAVSSWGHIPPGIYILTITGNDQIIHREKMLIP